MERLPLFPLNTVLFPHMPIYLHIFEDRYKLMIGRCVEERRPFGVLLIKSGSEVQGMGPTAEPYTIGCAAHITQVQPLGDGRMNIVALGNERFRVERFHDDEPYLTGDVVYLPSTTPNVDVLRRQTAGLRTSLERYLRALEKADNNPLDLTQLPNDPLALTYLAASVLRIPSAEKQDLLHENDMLRLVTFLSETYRREVMLLEIMATPAAVNAAAGPFSAN